MKRKLLFLGLIAFIASSTITNVQKKQVIDIALGNVESSASGEGGSNVWYQPRTVSCDLREGPWHTASVERICEFCCVPYSCTPVKCGDIF